MKKLLAILGAVGLTATGASGVVACGTSQKDNKDQVSELAWVKGSENTKFTVTLSKADASIVATDFVISSDDAGTKTLDLATTDGFVNKDTTLIFTLKTAITSGSVYVKVANTDKLSGTLTKIDYVAPAQKNEVSNLAWVQGSENTKFTVTLSKADASIVATDFVISSDDAGTKALDLATTDGFVNKDTTITFTLKTAITSGSVYVKVANTDKLSGTLTKIDYVAPAQKNEVSNLAWVQGSENTKFTVTLSKADASIVATDFVISSDDAGTKTLDLATTDGFVNKDTTITFTLKTAITSGSVYVKVANTDKLSGTLTKIDYVAPAQKNEVSNLAWVQGSENTKFTVTLSKADASIVATDFVISSDDAGTKTLDLATTDGFVNKDTTLTFTLKTAITSGSVYVKVANTDKLSGTLTKIDFFKA